MTEEQAKPFIKVGLATFPMTTSNFTTGPDGQNMIADVVTAMMEQVLVETVKKLMQVTGAYCQTMGVEFYGLTEEEQKAIVLERIKSIDEPGTKLGVKDDNGNPIFDQDYTAAKARGDRTDN